MYGEVSCQDIQLVQNLIVGCLQQYMSKEEVEKTLLLEKKIEPSLTELVWQKLEEENQEFFEAYSMRLMLKEQIINFNMLLARQVDLMNQMCPTGVASIPMSNGSHIPPMHQSSACYAPEHMRPFLKPENMHQPIGFSSPNAFANGGSSLHSGMQTAVDMSAHARRIDVSPNMQLAQSSNVGMVQGANGGVIKSEGGYAGSSQFMFGSDGNVMETHPAGNVSVSSFSSVESSSQPLNETLLDADMSSYGILGQIPGNLSLSDFSNDILESYPRSSFLTTDGDSFLSPHGGVEHQGDNKRLNTISESLGYDDFGSD
ncbi:hypothetical protein F0562_017509 [Nyssa sinensis]|uniref:Uncharacterized protein n=1 Tax=Nyssa sinensis TaxID=561372 RepID=A0A5J4ZGU3_9ASTE|nr:hypothetical protein F0562_017509 [Nyssa sinensis]